MTVMDRSRYTLRIPESSQSRDNSVWQNTITFIVFRLRASHFFG
jgi:hypothetical protein